jgi:hypothetical protein
MRVGAALATWALAVLAFGPFAQAADVIVSTNITVSTTWTPDNEYILDGIIYVTSGATLTIEPGTVVRGLPDASTTGTNNPGTLVITRGSKIRAIGTKLNPIVFTDENDDNVGSNPGSFPYDDPINASTQTGNWGGLILLGRGYVASNTVAGPNPARTVQIEGLVADGTNGIYGGCSSFPTEFPGTLGCDDDDSGSIKYVSLRYGGFGLAANNEINALTLGGVGRGTDIEYVEAFQNSDDSFEMFGGAVNLKHMVAVGVGDDGLDVDEGWRGKVQFLFNLQGTAGGQDSDKGSEQDSGTSGDGSQPFATQTVYNATMIGKGGSTAAAANYTNRLFNSAMAWRDNGGGRWYNSFFGDFGGDAMVIEGGTIAQGATAASTSGARAIAAYTPGTGNCSVTTATTCTTNANCPGGEVCVLHYLDPDSDFQLEVQDTQFWCIGRQELLAAGGFPAAAPRTPLSLPTFGVCTGTAVQCLTDAGCGGAPGSCQDKPIDYLNDGDATKLHYDNGGLSNAALHNSYTSCASAMPIRSLVRNVRAAPDFDQVTQIDPRPAVGQLTTTRIPPADGFFEPAPYKGAFAPNENWADGWTNASRLGYFPPPVVTNVNANITTSQTWTQDHDYFLDGIIYVTSGATLTIEPGTVVRGRPDSSTTGTNNPGTLVITRGSKIQALGTPDAPIVFTDENDDAVRGHLGTFPYDDPINASTQTGNWGGLILLGRGYVASNTVAGPNPARTVQIEGLVADGTNGIYGGCSSFPTEFPGTLGCDDDDSGSIKYVSLRYGGFGLAANNEINALTLGGVGRGTDIEYVEAFQNSDDSFEMFGGAVNLKHMVAVGVGDDGLDVDEGWRGKVQFLFNLQGTAGGQDSDKGSEQDSGTSGDGSQPFATQTVYNATMIGKGGSTAAAANYTNRLFNSAMAWRDNGGGRWYNSFFGDFGGDAMVIEGGTIAQGATAASTSGARAIAAYTPGTGNCSVTTATTCTTNANCPGGEVCVKHYLGPDSDFQLEVQDTQFWCIGRQELLAAGGFPAASPRAPLTLPTFGVCAGTAAQCLTDAGCGGAPGSCQDKPIDYLNDGDATKLHYDNAALSNAALRNSYASCASAMPLRSLVRSVRSAPDFDPVIAIDPRPATGQLESLDTPHNPPNDGFFEPAPYKGAFGGEVWTAGWSNADRLGYHPSCDGSNGAVPSEVNSLSFGSTKTVLRWNEPPLTHAMGVQWYDVLRSGAASNFSGVTCVEQDDTDRKATDTQVPAASSVFFYLVRASNRCGDGDAGFRSSGAPITASCAP